MSREELKYSVGDLVACPISNVFGVILEVFEEDYFVEYKIHWQDSKMNFWKRKWDHYEICKIN